MSELKFTPGPWNQAKSTPSLIEVADGNTVAQSFEIYDGSNDTNRLQVMWANAKLIAAAPDMFEIIKELYDWAQDTQTFGPIYPKLEAAYKKATGK